MRVRGKRAKLTQAQEKITVVLADDFLLTLTLTPRICLTPVPSSDHPVFVAQLELLRLSSLAPFTQNRVLYRRSPSAPRAATDRQVLVLQAPAITNKFRNSVPSP